MCICMYLLYGTAYCRSVGRAIGRSVGRLRRQNRALADFVLADYGERSTEKGPNFSRKTTYSNRKLDIIDHNELITLCIF